MLPDAIASSVARLPQRKIWQRHAFAFNPLKLFLFAVAYFLAYEYGNFSQTVASPLWFPDSVLLCALLLTPINEWWFYLVVAVPIRFIPTHHPAVPLWFVFATTANDLIKATLAAYLLRRLPNGSRHPSTLPQLATFLAVAVFFIPVLSAFAGAATRYLLGYGFWVSCYQWFLGDALANLVLTPALLYWSSKYFRALIPRTAEPMAWIAGFALALMLALSLARSAYSPIAVCIPIPFLIWAATRFGLIGASTSLSAIALLATARIAEKGWLFSTGFESKSLLFLQLFLFVVSIPVLCIAAVIEEKSIVEKNLRESEQRLRLAQSAARIGTFEWDIRTGVNSWTPELEAMYGLPPGGFGGTQTAFEHLVHPDDRARVIELDDWALKTGQPTTGEWRVVWPDGSVHWIAGRWQVFMDESRNPSRMVGVNIDVTVSKRAEQALEEMNRALREQSASLRSQEELLKIFVKNVPAGVAMLDRDMRYLEVSERWCADYSVDASQVLGRSHYEILPDIPQRWKEANRRALDGETVRVEEDRWDREGGFATWVRQEIRPWKTPNGSVGGILIFSEDITHRKQMEEVLSGMTRKLVEAQEQERARIARELHDDITQRLAMLAIEIEQVQACSEKPSELRNRTDELSNRAKEISNDIQALSHELHSSRLEYFGIVRGMKSWCSEFSERQGMEIEFKSSGLPNSLPPETSLCLFRVLQEALHNAAKHSGVKHVDVQLREDSGEVQLIVSDLGKGFDVGAAKQDRGLGVTSMQERVRLVGGTIVIDSKPLGGTTIHVRVPLGTERSSQREAG
jgi:PAS domain S-box-containing protein